MLWLGSLYGNWLAVDARPRPKTLPGLNRYI